jgi:hypothetical protein
MKVSSLIALFRRHIKSEIENLGSKIYVTYFIDFVPSLKH